LVERLPAEAEAKYNKYVKLREMLAAISRERASLEALITEIEQVVEELEKLGDDVEAYKLMGSVLVRKSKKELLDEHKERKEELEVRVKALKNQEDALRQEVEKLARELQRLLSGVGKGGPPAG